MKKLSILFLSILLACATLVTTACAATPYVSSSTAYHGAEPDERVPQHYSATESATDSAIRLSATKTTSDVPRPVNPTLVNPNRFACIIEVRDENGPVSTLSANETYTLRITIFIAGEHDAQNVRVRITDYMRIEGHTPFSGKYAVPMLYISADEFESRTACAKADVADTDRLDTKYIPDSATLTLNDGVTVLPLNDYWFAGPSGAKIGTGSADGNLLVGSSCVVEFKFATTEYNTTPSTSKRQPADHAPVVTAKPANPQSTPSLTDEEIIAENRVLVANDINFDRRITELERKINQALDATAVLAVVMIINGIVDIVIMRRFDKRVKQLEEEFYDSEDPSLDPPDEDQSHHDDEGTAGDLDDTRRFEWDLSELDEHTDHKVD